MDYRIKIVCRGRIGLAEEINEELKVAHVSQEQYSSNNIQDFYFDISLVNNNRIDTEEPEELFKLVEMRLNHIVDSIVEMQNPLYIMFPMVISSCETNKVWALQVQKKVSNMFINKTHYFNPKVLELVVTSQEGVETYVPFKDYMLHQNEVNELASHLESEVIELKEYFMVSQ